MIDKLTPEQEVLLKQRTADWLAVGLDTTTNENLSEQTITKMYALLGKPAPKFVWYDSPKAMGKELSNTSFWGSLDAFWIGFYTFGREIGVKYTDEDNALLDLWADVARANFWWNPQDDACHISRKPVEIHMVNGRLHNENGPALLFKDGFKMYNLNGIRVPAWLVTTPADELDVQLIYKQDNVEIRQELVRKIGGKRVVKDLGLKELEFLTGEELYNKYPVGDWYQQGDVWFLNVENGDKITNLGKGIDKCEKLTQISLRNGVFYRLYAGKIGDLETRVLHMGNPSVFGDEHYEFVDEECKSIIEALGFRNQQVLSTAGIDWRKDTILLPHALS